MDSLYQARLALSITEEAQKDSLLKLQREIQLKAFRLAQADTITQVVLGQLKLAAAPNMNKFSKAKKIDLHFNKIQKINKRAWPKTDSLESINLENNALKKVSFRKNHSIKRLNLSNNLY